MKISQDLLDQVVKHAQRDHTDECCGVIELDTHGAAVAVHELDNVLDGPKRLGFAIDGLTLMKLDQWIEDDGNRLGVIYHSHTRSAPYPSQTDINYAAGWPGVEWLIVGTSTDPAEVKSYLIDATTITEVQIEIL